MSKDHTVATMSSNRGQSDDDGVSVVDSCDFLDDDAHSVGNAGKDQERQTLARKEDTAVRWMRGLVFLALFATTFLVSTRVYLYTRGDQEKDFEYAFEADGTKLLESFENSISRRIEAIDSLGVSMTSFAKATGATFPNVTFPDFGIRCSSSRILSSSVFIQYHPLVTEEQRLGWEAYQIENRHHYDEALMTEVSLLQFQDFQLNQSDTRRLQEKSDLRDTIENLTPNGTSIVAPYGTGPYLPMWQNSPVTPTKALLNFNALSHPSAARGYAETLKTGQAVIEAASNLAGEHLGRTGIFFKAMLSMSQYRYDIDEYLGEPVSTFAYPVFDSFDLVNRKVVGVIGTSLYWRLYFKNVLRPNTRGIICVLENTLNQTFSYRIDDTVTYLGIGDHHDPRYDHLVKESDVASLIKSEFTAETKSFTSVILNTAYCSYKIRIYPSKDTEKQYVNSDPFYLTLVIIGVFLFTSTAFLLFTVAVNRRQRVVMDRAIASSAIVSSLFPSQVRDQIYQENTTEQRKRNWQRTDGPLCEAPESTTDDRTGRPIAELFEHTTVMFADIVGFTSWSSTRNPVQVFELLETLYQAFDTIAVRRKVFKVETIGDCYVAVAGLPQPQDDHALIMTRFARDCMNAMNQLTMELSDSLGADTADLTMRVGLHSGPVTGGVLRGQKSRFQLFGDTMNTAARMESNGSPRWIHISQGTADELAKHGKSTWVTPRKDKILAKGKGELQTFWVSSRSTEKSTYTKSVMSSDPADTGRAQKHSNKNEFSDEGENHVVETFEI